MTEDEFTCIKKVVKTVRLALPATFVAKEIAGVTEILDSWKRQYIHQLQGIVVSYENVKLASHSGFISVQKPCVYYKVTATFHLFCPVVGDIVKGKINHTSREHVGCLVQNTINVTIPLSKNASPELSKYIYLEGDVLFEVTHFDFERKAIRVTGDITPRCLELMNDIFPDPAERFNNVTEELQEPPEDMGYSNAKDSTEDEESQSLLMSPTKSSTHKKARKKKKNNASSESVDELANNIKEEILSPLISPIKDKKTKKRKRGSLEADTGGKKKKKRESTQLQSLHEAENNVKEETISLLKCPKKSSEDKKSKKRKRESSESETGSKTKKKKKHKDKGLNKKKGKPKNEKKASKKKAKLTASGGVLKKDKKNKVNSKVKSKKSKHKSKKSKDGKKNKKIKLDVNIKSEPLD